MPVGLRQCGTKPQTSGGKPIAKRPFFSSVRWAFLLAGGTASELIDVLALVDIIPNVLTRRLNVSVDELANCYGISLKYKWTHTGRLIILEKTE